MFKLLFDTKNRNFLRLWLAQLISQFGDRINQLALVGLIAERAGGSALELAKLISFTILPVFFIQHLAGVSIDSLDRRRTLFVGDIFRGLLVLTIPFIFIHRESMIPIYGIVFFAFCFSRFYVPAKMSIIPDLVPKENLLMANSLVTTTGMIAFVLGCALGGFLIDKFGARIGFIIDAATFFVSALFVSSINLPIRLKFNKDKILQAGKEIVGTIKQSFWGEAKEGMLYLTTHQEIRFIINTLFILLSAAGAVYVVLIVFIQQSFQSITKDLGILAVCLGGGLFLGAIGYGRWGKKWVWYKTIFFCLILGGLTLIVFSWMVYRYPNIAVAMGLAFSLGLILGPIFIASYTMVHLASEESMRGKVFSALEIVMHSAFLIAMLISSWVSGFVPRVWILIAVGALFACLGFLGLYKIKKGSLALMR